MECGSVTLYVVAEMWPDEEMQQKAIREAFLAGDWYFSAIAAGSDMDQVNMRILEEMPENYYWEGMFTLFGVFKFEAAGLVTNYEV